MEEKAKKIAEIIMKTETEDRGDLLHEVGQILYKNHQNHTGRVFQDAAVFYGPSNK